MIARFILLSRTRRLSVVVTLCVAITASLSVTPTNVGADERPAPSISPALARAYLDNAGSKLDAEDYDAARAVLSLLMRADGVPPDIVRQAAEWLAGIDGASITDEPTDVDKPAVQRRIVTIRSTDVPSVEVTEPRTAPVSAPGASANATALATPARAPEQPIAGPDPEPVTAKLEQSLEEFFARAGRYPAGYSELNELLPPGEAPLSEFDIVYYVARYGGYILTIRNRAISESEMTIQRTGLIK